MNQEEKLAFLKTRRSIRKYADTPLDSQQLSILQQLATLAPSAMNEQGWFFVLIQNKEFIQQLETLANRKGCFYGAPCVIVAFAKKEAIDGKTDTVFAMSNIMYGAHALGLGTCFIYCMKGVFNDEQNSSLKHQCHVPDDYECIGSLAIGYPLEEKEIPTNRNQDVFSYMQE